MGRQAGRHWAPIVSRDVAHEGQRRSARSRGSAATLGLDRVAARAARYLELGVGLATGSLALVSAAIESSGDVISATLTFFAVRLGGRPADSEHPYGHRRAENLGALGEAAILLAGGVLVSVEAITPAVTAAAPSASTGTSSR